MTQYKYDPVGIDRIDPCVLYGDSIKPGSKVTITKSNVDPLKKFVFIVDEKGNRQSVYKSSLNKIPLDKHNNSII